MTKYEKVLQDFPIGTKVEVTTDLPAWDPHPGYPARKVVCGHDRYRDSDDDPIICVALVSITAATIGWFWRKDIKRVK